MGSDDVVAEKPRTCESELGLPPEFLDHLLLEDDWSFVIKAHALVEAKIGHLLTEALDHRLTSIFEGLELSNAAVGKIVLAEKVDLIPSSEKRFIGQFSELRNGLVHNVRQVAFRFDDYLGALGKNQRSALTNAVVGSLGTSSVKGTLEKLFRADPKLAIWTVVVLVLTNALSKARRESALRALVASAKSGRVH